MSAVYFMLLPSRRDLAPLAASTSAPPTYAAYTALPQGDPDSIAASLTLPAAASAGELEGADRQEVKLTLSHFSGKEKLALAKPLVWRYMAPLFLVYLAEYTVGPHLPAASKGADSVGSGEHRHRARARIPDPVARGPPHLREADQEPARLLPALAAHIPGPSLRLRPLHPNRPFLQTFVFLSRSSTSLLRLPALPISLIPLPSLLQLCLLLVALLEASTSLLSSISGPSWIYAVVWLLIGCEGVFGGTAYVACYHWLGVEQFGEEEQREPREVKVAKREFRIACVGFADTMGSVVSPPSVRPSPLERGAEPPTDRRILAASLLSSWLEPTLCAIQVDRGRTLCREV